MKSLKGHLLLAAPSLLDPNFVQTVVLMVQHDENGALGLILNRPLSTTVKEACEQALQTACTIDSILHQGGPCEGPLMVVHTEPSAGQIEVTDGVHFTTDRAAIEGLLVDSSINSKYFVGYAGWTAGQLESEMETGSWLVAPADRNEIFTGGDDQWTRLMRQLRLGRWVDPDHIPDDPSVN